MDNNSRLAGCRLRKYLSWKSLPKYRVLELGLSWGTFDGGTVPGSRIFQWHRADSERSLPIEEAGRPWRPFSGLTVCGDADLEIVGCGGRRQRDRRWFIGLSSKRARRSRAATNGSRGIINQLLDSRSYWGWVSWSRKTALEGKAFVWCGLDFPKQVD